MIIIWLIVASLIIFGILIYLKYLQIEPTIAVLVLFVGITGGHAAYQYHLNVSDQEILNGKITTKRVWQFSCPMNTSNPCTNDYACNCHPVRYVCGSDAKTGATQYCTRIECDTCYTYPWEKNWYVSSTIFNDMQIKRVDDQGAVEPPRWTATQPNDPVSMKNTYDNWVKAAYDSLFHKDEKSLSEELKKKVPSYPLGIYDYYKIDRVLTVGYNLPNTKEWNVALSEALKDIGSLKQINVVIVMYKGLPDDFPNAVRNVWRGFKKNDAVIFLQFDQDDIIERVSIMSWSKKDMFNVVLRDELFDLYGGHKIANVNEFMNVIKTVTMQHYQRRSMQEFEYLKDDIEVSDSIYYVWFICLLFSFVGSFFLTKHFRNGYNHLHTNFRRFR